MKKELEIKDVMVGDWVDVRNNAAPNTPHLERITPSHFLRDEHWYGVELVPEILEKNGFEVTRNMSSSRNKDVWSLHVSKYKIFHIIEHHNKKMFPYFWIEIGSNSDIKYVHELQHALRLCRIEKEIIL